MPRLTTMAPTYIQISKMWKFFPSEENLQDIQHQVVNSQFQNVKVKKNLDSNQKLKVLTEGIRYRRMLNKTPARHQLQVLRKRAWRTKFISTPLLHHTITSPLLQFNYINLDQCLQNTVKKQGSLNTSLCGSWEFIDSLLDWIHFITCLWAEEEENSVTPVLLKLEMLFRVPFNSLALISQFKWFFHHLPFTNHQCNLCTQKGEVVGSCWILYE